MGQEGDSHEPGKPRRTYPWETVHVFVSSTFNDMHGERDYLVKHVFPELRDWCEERKLRLVDIDLRWGVTETDATRNKNVVQVCLDRIDKARPFFICFLGQRYGWVPKEKEIAEQTFKDFSGLKDAVADSSSVTEMEVLHALLRKPFDKEPGKRLPMDHAFFYMRTPAYSSKLSKDPMPLRRIYADAAEPDPVRRRWLLNKRKRLRQRIREESRRPVRWYGGRWNPEARTPELALPLQCPSSQPENRERWRQQWREWAGVETTDEKVVDGDEAKAQDFSQHLCAGRLEDFWSEGRSLGEVILDDLKAAILARYPERTELPEQDDLEKEIDRHEDFIRTATDVFIEREGDFAALDAYASGDSRKLFVLVAKAGLGKSTLLARWGERWRSRAGRSPGETVHARFVGVGERSNSVDSLLRSILEELRRAGKLASEIPDDANVLRSKLGELLAECGKNGRVVVVIDALNQLQSGLTDLDWLPREPPENVKLIISFKLGEETGDNLAAQMRGHERVLVSEVQPFASLEHRRGLVTAYLAQYLKELDERHLEALIRAEGADNPLFLKVVLTELRVFGAFGQLGEVIRREFGTSPQSAFEAVLRRLESDPSYAAVSSQQAVPLLFGLLAHSRGGLPEDLLARMFLAELGLSEERRADMAATIQLFLRQVRPFLARRDGRTDFFYESFQIAAKQRYTSETGRPASAWHGLLAHLCGQWRDLSGSAQRYALRNLPRHAVAAGQAGPAVEAVTEFGYHYERLRRLGREDVANVTADLALVDGVAGLPAPIRERLGVWEAFHAENAHLFRQRNSAPETALLQLAVEHANTSPVTESAERWLKDVGSEVPWFRSLGRPHERERSACLRTFEGHANEVDAVAALPDGKRAISGSWDNTLKLWDLETGQCLRTFEGHTGWVEAVALLPDGKRALSGSWDKTLKLWDIETGKCLRTFQGHTNRVVPVAALPNGKRAISGSWDGTVKLWDIETGQCLRTLENWQSSFVCALPDGKRAISSSKYGTLKLWNLETGQCLHTLEGHTNTVNDVAFLPDGKRALSGAGGLGGRDHTLRLWDLETGQCLCTLDGHGDWVKAVAALPDGKRAISASQDGTLKLWDLETEQCLCTLKGHKGALNDVALLPDGRRAISGSSDKSLKLWNLEAGRHFRTREGHSLGIRVVALLPDGRRAISGSDDNTLKLWDVETGHCLRTLNQSGQVLGDGYMDNPGKVTHVVPLPDGKRALSCTSDRVNCSFAGYLVFDNTLKLWDLQTGRCLRTLKGHTMPVNTIALLPHGRGAISVSDDETLRLWDIENGQCLSTLAHEGRAPATLLPDGKRAISGMSNKTLKLWDLETGQCLRILEGHKVWAKATFLPDGERAISGCGDDTLRLWDLKIGQCLHTLQGHKGRVHAVAALPDRKRAISGGWDHTLKLWDLETGQCLRTLQGHTEEVFAVAALPDDKRAISGSGDNTLKLWDVETGHCLRTLQGHTGKVHAVAALPDGKRALSGSADKTLRLWDVETGHCLRTLQGHAEAVDTVAASPDGKRALSGGRDHTLKLWDVESGQCLRTLQGHADGVMDIAFMPDGKRAISNGFDRACASASKGWTLKLWDLETGRCLQTRPGSQQGIALSHDARHAISGIQDDALKLWDLATGQCLRTLEGHKGKVHALVALPDGKRAISASWDHTLKLWDLETGRCLHTLDGHSDGVYGVALLPDGRRAISSSGDCTLRLWELDTGKCLRTFEGHGGTVALLPDGKRAVSVSEDLRLWDIETGRHLASWQTADRVADLAAGPEVIVAGTISGHIFFLRLMSPGRIVPEAIATWHPSRLAHRPANSPVVVRGGALPAPARKQSAPLDGPSSGLGQAGAQPTPAGAASTVAGTPQPTESAIIEARGGAPEQFKQTVRRARKQLRKHMNPSLLEAFNRFSNAVNSEVTGAELEEIGKHLLDTLDNCRRIPDPVPTGESARAKQDEEQLVAHTIAVPLEWESPRRADRIEAYRIEEVKIESIKSVDDERGANDKSEVDVAFTIFCADTSSSSCWESLFVCLHRDALLATILPDGDRKGRSVRGPTHARRLPMRLGRGAGWRLVPRAEGVEFDPPAHEFVWCREPQEREFRFRPRPETAGTRVAGVIEIHQQTENERPSMFLEPLPFTLSIGAAQKPPTQSFWRKLFGGGRP